MGFAYRATMLLLVIALFGCAGAKTSVIPLEDNRPLANRLPPLPLDVPGHSTATVQNMHIDGSAAVSQSAGAFVQATNMNLSSSFNGLEWAIWRYTPGVGETVQSAVVNMTVNAGTSGWLAIADYGNNHWSFLGPFVTGGGGNMTFSGLDAAGFHSPAGNIYFLAAAYGGTSSQISGIDVTTDIPAPTTYTISGTVTDTSTSLGISGATVSLLQGGNPFDTKITDASGNYAFTDLPAGTYDIYSPVITGYDVQPVQISNVSVGPDSPGNDFSATPIGPVGVTYETGAGEIKALIDDRCVYCHSPSGPGGPQTPYLRNWSEVQPWQTTIVNDVVFNSMPRPPKTMTTAERQKFTDWKNNGYAQ
jgi:hypothetical protein